MSNGSVTCPACNRNVALRKDGTLWRHQQWVAQGSGRIKEFPPPCDASGKTPEHAAIIVQSATVDRLNRITPEFQGRVRAEAVDALADHLCETDTDHGRATVSLVIGGVPFEVCPDCGERAVRDRLSCTTDLIDVEVYR